MRLYNPATHQVNAAIAQWAGDKLGVTFFPPYLALGIVPDNIGNYPPWSQLAGAVICADNTDANIELSVYAPGSLTPGIVRDLAHYVFVQLGKERLTLRTKRSNKRARKVLARHFKYECTAVNWFARNEDAIVFRMLRDECKWLRIGSDGKHPQAA